MITIGRLAEYAGVTVKAVRHYHQRGLLAEPGRDAAGYRRYTPRDAVDLVRIRTLADAGVPLARVKDLLRADRDALDTALTDIDRELRERIAHLRRTRDRLTQLRGDDRLFVSATAADFLDELRAMGVSERQVGCERDAWILARTSARHDAAAWIAERRTLFADPGFRALYLDHDAAHDWPRDDPRRPALAERTRTWQAHHDGVIDPVAAARSARPFVG